MADIISEDIDPDKYKIKVLQVSEEVLRSIPFNMQQDVCIALIKRAFGEGIYMKFWRLIIEQDKPTTKGD